jgi:hypothetical protein
MIENKPCAFHIKKQNNSILIFLNIIFEEKYCF